MEKINKIVIDGEDFKKLKSMVGKIPTEYGMGIMMMLDQAVMKTFKLENEAKKEMET